ncbi:hypothetical protein DQW77_01205 [Roseovarius sp. TE539]|uniref:hypothetical protein n=1 Tax=Roseovarius sp. TE539 TaxID=2249812 RepID=UPI000DDE7C48|nr:hypothetical protein [Roseovarius sp. TE539]RBI77641.1 hypothetical protein DQW77_01205 [Roseovarius sp. TE539]
MTLTEDDLRAAAAAGIIDESQAARLTSLAHSRAGRLAQGLAEDEPFELFRGFAEIFISVGLVLLLAGAALLATATQSMPVVAAVIAACSWLGALYFTRRRRMTLPSIVLVIGFGQAVGLLSIWVLSVIGVPDDSGLTIVFLGLIGIAAMLLHYRVFRVPFSMFLAGVYGLGVVFGITGAVTAADTSMQELADVFDLRRGGGLAIGTLVFGSLALVAAMWFDIRDPHRLGRMARSAFWLHLLAAPALVNTFAMTAYNIGGSAGMALTIGALILITGFALIIDRRSFLTAGLVYLGLVVAWAMRLGEGELSLPLMLLVLGAIVTYLGSTWVSLRVGLMRILPDFPGKNRLPPYSEAS